MGALFPIRRAIGVEKLETERHDRCEIHRHRFCEIGFVPTLRRNGQLACLIRHIPIVRRDQRHEMAHPDIMDDPPAIAEVFGGAQDARRGLVVAVVVGRRDLFFVRGDDDVAYFDDRALTLGLHFADRYRTGNLCGQRLAAALHVTVRRERDEHPVDVLGPHDFAGKRPACLKVGKPELDPRILRRSGGIVPQAYIPAACLPQGIAALDGKRWPVCRVERQDACTLPAKSQDAVRVIALRLVGEQRVIEQVLAVPDQPRKLALVQELAIDLQRIGCSGDDTRHHRTREIDSPETRVEPLDPVLVLVGALLGEPESHDPLPQFWRARRTALATCREDRCSAAGVLDPRGWARLMATRTLVCVLPSR